MTEASARRPHKPWSLQTRLMVTITGVVALILVGVALATSTILSSVLQVNLNATLSQTAQETHDTLRDLPFGPLSSPTEVTASDVLSAGRQGSGVLLVMRSPSSTLTGAVVDGDTVSELTTEQIDDVRAGLLEVEQSTLTIRGLGEYRVVAFPVQGYAALVGLSLGEVQSTIAQIITTVLLVTTGGLLLLGAAIAVVIRAGLRPLRAVADTATRVASMPLAQGSVSINERVPEAEADERTEIGSVGHALNTLLDHVDASLEERQRNEERMRRFVADASHELRTPLASIRGYSELSLRALRQAQGTGAQAQGTGAQAQRPGVVETTEQSLERIQAQSLRMTTLVEDLLLLARLDEGQELVYGSVDLTRLAVEAVGDAVAAGPDHVWELDAPEEPIVLAGDSARLAQVVVNLLANARTHTPAGTKVTVSVSHEGTDAVLRVHDDGPGIDPAVQNELFERFSRADRSRARKTGGTGLGLSIARAIVDAHTGSIAVRSVPGDTTFEVRLPAKPSAPAASGAPAAS